jgi:hypothetical protein
VLALSLAREDASPAPERDDSIIPAAAINAALTTRFRGTASNEWPPISKVRQGRSPQTEQHGLEPARAPSQSSIDLPPIHIRFDADESALNDGSSSTRVCSTG